jgi:hypothetical protein
LAAAGVIAVLLVLLGVVAATTGGGRPVTSRHPSGEAPQLLKDYAFTLAIVLAVTVVALLVATLATAKRPAQPRRLDNGRFLITLLVALVAIAVASRFVRVYHPKATEEPPSGIVVPRAKEPPPAEGASERSAVHFRWEVPLVVAVLVGAGVAYALSRRRREVEADDDAEVADELSAAIDLALDDLRAERDPRRAVIAAYARLEGVLAQHGLPRRPSEAPLEYLSRMLLELEVTPAAVLDLTELFEQAKFSRRLIDTSMKDEAIGALAAVRDDLRAAA